MEQDRGDDIVAVRMYIGGDDHFFTDDTLDGKPTAVDLRMNGLDYDAPELNWID